MNSTIYTTYPHSNSLIPINTLHHHHEKNAVIRHMGEAIGSQHGTLPKLLLASANMVRSWSRGG